MAPFSAMLKSKGRRPTRPPTPPSPASFYSPVTNEHQQRPRSTTLPSSVPAEGGNTALPAERVFPAHPYARQGPGGIDSPAPSESNVGEDDVLENISSFAFPLPPSNDVRKIRFADQQQKEQQSRRPGEPQRTSSEFKVSLHLSGQVTLQDMLLTFGLTEGGLASENVPEGVGRGVEQTRNRNRSATVPLLNVEAAPTPSSRKAAPFPIQIPIGNGASLKQTATSEESAPTVPPVNVPGSAYLTPLVSSSTAMASAGHSSNSPQSDTVFDPGSAAWRRMALSPTTTVTDQSMPGPTDNKPPGKRMHSRNSKPQPPLPLSPPYQTPTGPDSSFQAFQVRTRPPRPPHPPMGANSKAIASDDPAIANMVSSALARQSTGSAVTTFTTATVAPNIATVRSPTPSVLSIGAAHDMPFTPNFLMPSHRMSDDTNAKVRVDSATLPMDFTKLQREDALARSPLSGGLSPLSRPSITPSTSTPPPSAFERVAEVSKTKSARRSVSASDVRTLVLQAGQLVDSNVKRLADSSNEDARPNTSQGAGSAPFVLGRPPSIRRPSLTGSVRSGPIVPSQHAKSASISVPPSSGSPPVSASSSDGSTARGANGRQTPLSRSPLVPDLADIQKLRKGSEDSLNSIRSERKHQMEAPSEDLQRRVLNGAPGLVIIPTGEEQRLAPQKTLRRRRSFTKAPRPAPSPVPGQVAEDANEPLNPRRASLLHTRRPNPLAPTPRSNSIAAEPVSPRRERSASESVPLSPRQHIHRSSSISDLPSSPPLAPGSQAPSSFSAALGRAIYGSLTRKRSDPYLSSTRTPTGTLGESKQSSKPGHLTFAPSKIANGQLNSPSQFPQTPRPYSISTSSADHHHTLAVPPALIIQPPDGTRISITPSPASPANASPSVSASRGAARVAATLPIAGLATRKNKLTVATPSFRNGTPKSVSPVSPKPRSGNTPSPVETAFETNPIHWKGLTMDAAKWTLSSQQLQEIVSRAIRSSAEASAIRLLPPDVLNSQIPNEITRLELYREDVKAQYKYQSRRRSLLLRSLGLYVDGSDPETSRRLTEDLVECGETCDRLCKELFQITDQRSQLSQLTQRHNSSALSMALRKLNTSFIKAKGETIDLQLQLAMLEAERDEAWAVAENIERELDQVKHKVDGDLLQSPSPYPPSSWGSKSPRSTSRVSSAKKTSIRASKSSLRISSSSRSSGSSVRFAPIIPPNSPGLVAETEPPPVPVLRPDLHSRRTSSMVELTPSSSSKAMAQAQAQLFQMLGISQEDLVNSPRRRSYSEPSSPTSGPRRARTLSLPGSMGLLESPKVIAAVLGMRSESD